MSASIRLNSNDALTRFVNYFKIATPEKSLVIHWALNQHPVVLVDGFDVSHSIEDLCEYKLFDQFKEAFFMEEIPMYTSFTVFLEKDEPVKISSAQYIKNK